MVRAYMAHHQGMIARGARERASRRRDAGALSCRADRPGHRALLQERTPRDVAVARPRADEVQAVAARARVRAADRCVASARRTTAIPRTHLLSNGRYAVMVTAAGSGYSRWRDLAVTRWREDATRDGWGTYVFLRDVDSGAVWSAGYQPSGGEPDSYEVDVFRGPRRDSCGATARSRPRSKSSCRRRTTPRCGGCRSRISGRGHARSS